MGSKALGLHPFHPDAMALAPHQLHWASLMASEGFGKARREARQAQRTKAVTDAAFDLLGWMDKHMSTRPKP